MRLTTTTWRPDTCDCKLEYEWDRDLPAEDREHTIKNVHKTCKAHKDKSTKEEKYDYVLDENQTKNIVHAALMENLPDAVEEVTIEGKKVKELKPGKEYKWLFNNKRELEVDMSGFTPEEKAIVEGLNLGTEKTKVVLK